MKRARLKTATNPAEIEWECGDGRPALLASGKEDLTSAPMLRMLSTSAAC